MEFVEIDKQQALQTQSDRAEQFAASYDEMRANPYGTCFNYSRRRLDVWLERYLPSSGDGLRLLDVGCGTGHHMARLRQRGFVVAGVDASEEMLEHARANNPGAEIHEGDAEKLPFPDQSFDFVLCIEVLRHLPRSARCIREMGRVLKPGGVCLATATPLLNLNGYALINRIAHRYGIGNLARHRQAFHTSSRLRREFIDGGFAVPDIHGVYMGPVNWVERIAPRAVPRFLKAWEPFDAALADNFPLREFCNLFFVHGVRHK